MKLIWTSQAMQDRDGIYDYIDADNPSAAASLDEIFVEKAKILKDYTHLGRASRIAGTRELVVHRNYILLYDINGDTVRILRVLHTSRQWPFLEKARLP